MAETIQAMLHAALWRCADYQERQWLKSGDLTAAARSILQRNRKAIVRHKAAFIALLLAPLVINGVLIVVARWNGASDGRPGIELGLIALVALVQLPALLDHRAVLTRLETLLTLWLLHGAPDSRSAESSLEELLS